MEDTLLACADSIGFENKQFLEVLKSEETEHRLQQHLKMTYQLQVSGFPALFYIDEKNRAYPLAKRQA